MSAPKLVTPFSGWHEHIPFVMYLTSVLKPEMVVELGTQGGDSYCAVCQAVKELKLNTRCFAVDTWRGDPQSGFYGPEVLEDLRAHHDPLYGGFSRLIKSTFDEALSHFADGTITLLHIDGNHTYEAVKHDFESWLSKVSRRGVILFHATNVRASDFGVWRLWAELKQLYPHFEFVHGHGLGVLGVGKEQVRALRELYKSSGEEIAMTRDLFFRLGHRMTVQAQSDAERKSLLQKIAGIEQAALVLSAQLNQKEQAIQALSAQLNQKEQAIQAARLSFNRRDEAAKGLEARLSQIQNSHGWRALQHFYTWRDKLLPQGSLRRATAKLFWTHTLGIQLLRDMRLMKSRNRDP